MKTLKRSLLTFLLLGMLLSLAMPALAAEGTDYDALFTNAAENGEDPLIDAMVEDPAAFLKALAFQDRETQLTVINVMAEGASISEWTVIRYLISWAIDDRELTKSEESVIAALRYAINYADYSFLRAYKSGDELKSLMEEALTADGVRSEALSSEFAEAIKGDAIGFIRVLIDQDKAVQQQVVALMHYHCYWELGNVLIDILNQVKEQELTDAEAGAVDALLERLKDTPEPVGAVGPDAEELAAYLAGREPGQTEGAVTMPGPTEQTEPEPTHETPPVLFEPFEEQMVEQAKGISMWWLLLIPLGMGTGFLLGVRRKKRKNKAWEGEWIWD